MKRILCMLIVVMLCACMAIPAFAVENQFVPSITYKEGPRMGRAYLDGTDVGDCVVVTSILQAEKKTTDITQEERDLLLDVYEKLEDGSMTLPLEKNYVIRELVDVSFEYQDCRVIEEHNHKDVQLKKEGVTLTVHFDLGISKSAEVLVMTYIDGKWDEIVSVENNGDGTVTCVFEDICPVAFVVKENSNSSNPLTGDAAGNNLILWGGMMALCAVALVVLVVPKLKRK